MKNTKLFQRLTAAALAALMGLTVSCGTEETPGGDTTASSVTTDASDTDPREQYKDMMPAVEDFGGYEFRILAYTDHNIVRGIPVYDADEITGDTVSDAVYKRNRLVEEDYNVDISVLYTANIVNEFTRATMAGDDFCDLVSDWNIPATFALLPQGVALDLNTMPEFRFDAPWWSDSMKDVEVFGKQFFLIGDISPVFDLNIICVTYNQDIYEDMKFENPYKMVNEGRWTFDKLSEMARAVSRDLDGDTKITVTDQIGLLTEISAAMHFFTASGESILKLENGEYKLSFGSEKCFDVFERAFELMFDFDHTFPMDSGRFESQLTTSTIWTEATKIMSESRALFRTGTFGDTAEYRDMKADFGVLPIPKYDEKQENYYCTLGSNCQPLLMPVTVTDAHRTALITEALCMQGKFVIMPEFYDVFLDEKVLRDEESKKMVDLMFASAAVNVDGWFGLTGITTAINNMVKTGTYTLASEAASLQSSAEAKLKTAFGGIKALK